MPPLLHNGHLDQQPAGELARGVVAARASSARSRAVVGRESQRLGQLLVDLQQVLSD
jgi:hypothetical protein